MWETVDRCRLAELMSAWQIEKQKRNRKKADGHSQGSYTCTLCWRLTLKAIHWLTEGLFTHVIAFTVVSSILINARVTFHLCSFIFLAVFASRPAVHESRLTVLSTSQHWPHLLYQWPPVGMLLHVDHHPATAVLQVSIFSFICTATIPSEVVSWHWDFWRSEMILLSISRFSETLSKRQTGGQRQDTRYE